MNEYFNPTKELTKKFPKVENKRWIGEVFNRFETIYKERVVLNSKLIDELLNKFNGITPTKKTWKRDLSFIVENYTNGLNKYSVPFEERKTLIPRDNMNFYLVRCKENEFVWMSDGLKSQNFVDFDFWLSEKKDRNWIISNIVKGYKKNSRLYDYPCFVRKKQAIVKGPIACADEIISKLNILNYLVYDSKENAFFDKNKKPYNDKVNLCLIYDLVNSGEGLLRPYEELMKKNMKVKHAVLLYNYDLVNKKFPFSVEFIIKDPWVSQRNLSLRLDKDIIEHRKNYGREIIIRFYKEDEAYGKEIIIRSGRVRYLSNPERFSIPLSTKEILDKKA